MSFRTDTMFRKHNNFTLLEFFCEMPSLRNGSTAVELPPKSIHEFVIFLFGFQCKNRVSFIHRLNGYYSFIAVEEEGSRRGELIDEH